MADRFTTSGPPRKLYRVARTADATAFAPWKYANADHVFSGRWDDPQGTFRSLYSGDSAEGAYIESLQDFRRSTQLIAALQKIEQNDPDFERMDPPAPGTGSGIVPAAWFEGRFLGEFTVDGGRYVDILAVESIELVRIRLAQRSLELGLSNVSAGTLLGEQRAFTQALAVYDDPGGYAGIHAPSSLGLPGSNYALFESGPSSEIARAPAQLLYVAPVGPEDPALQRAVKSLGLELERIELDRLRLSGSRGLAIVSESDVAQAARHELQNGGISDEHIRQLPAPSGTAPTQHVGRIIATGTYHIAQEVGDGTFVLHERRMLDRVVQPGEFVTIDYAGQPFIQVSAPTRTEFSSLAVTVPEMPDDRRAPRSNVSGERDARASARAELAETAIARDALI